MGDKRDAKYETGGKWAYDPGASGGLSEDEYGSLTRKQRRKTTRKEKRGKSGKAADYAAKKAEKYVTEQEARLREQSQNLMMQEFADIEELRAKIAAGDAGLSQATQDQAIGKSLEVAAQQDAAARMEAQQAILAQGGNPLAAYVGAPTVSGAEETAAQTAEQVWAANQAKKQMEWDQYMQRKAAAIQGYAASIPSGVEAWLQFGEAGMNALAAGVGAVADSEKTQA
tara:strand:- start:615 stop:1295 length:681 start_codon:yes stop_codon:yes gene_type:complete